MASSSIDYPSDSESEIDIEYPSSSTSEFPSIFSESDAENGSATPSSRHSSQSDYSVISNITDYSVISSATSVANRLTDMSLCGEDGNRMRDELKTPTPHCQPKIISLIQGSWRPISISNIPRLWQVLGMSDLEFEIFRDGKPSFRFEGDVLTMSTEYYGRHFYTSTSILEKPSEAYGYIRTVSIDRETLLVVDKKAGGIGGGGGKVMNREERFVVGGKLHIMVERPGVKCRRVYERVLE